MDNIAVKSIVLYPQVFIQIPVSNIYVDIANSEISFAVYSMWGNVEEFSLPVYAYDYDYSPLGNVTFHNVNASNCQIGVLSGLGNTFYF